MTKLIVSGSLWTTKIGEVIKVTSVARTTEETWISFSQFGDPTKSSTLIDSVFLQQFKPYNLTYGN